MKLIRQSMLVATVCAACSTAVFADAPVASKAIKLTDAQLAKYTAAGSIQVNNRDRTVVQYNSGVEGTSFYRPTRQTTLCKPETLC